MTDDQEPKLGTVRILNFQGQTGFDPKVLTTRAGDYTIAPSDEAARVSYTISYPGSDIAAVSVDDLSDDFADAMQRAAFEHLEMIKSNK